MCSRPPSGCLKPRMVQNVTYILFFLHSPPSLTGSTAQLLRSVSELPASLLSCVGAVSKSDKGPCTRALQYRDGDLAAQAAAEWLTGGGAHGVGRWTKGWLTSRAGWSGMSRDLVTPTQNGLPLKTRELFTSGIFHLTLSDHSWPQVAETVEGGAPEAGGWLRTPRAEA